MAVKAGVSRLLKVAGDSIPAIIRFADQAPQRVFLHGVLAVTPNALSQQLKNVV
jgi:hypothetical protein